MIALCLQVALLIWSGQFTAKMNGISEKFTANKLEDSREIEIPTLELDQDNSDSKEANYKVFSTYESSDKDTESR